MRKPTWARIVRTFLPIMAGLLVGTLSDAFAGRGNLGSKLGDTTSLTGNKPASGLTGTPMVTVFVGSSSFSQAFDPNDPNTATTAGLRDRLVALIDADAGFSATVYVDPFDPNDASFSVLTQTGGEIPDMRMCEDFVGIRTAGVSFAGPMINGAVPKAATITGVSLDANAPVFVVTIRPGTGSTFVGTYNTSVPPDNTASGLNAHVKSDLLAAGYSVLEGPSEFVISKPSANLSSVKVFSTDSGFTSFCVGLDTAASPPPPPPPPGGAPTLSELGLLTLILLLALAALSILARRARPARPV